MKFPISLIALALLTFWGMSCTDELKLYHERPEPEPYWLLSTVDYPSASIGGLQYRPDFQLEYNAADSIITIDNTGGDYIMVQYRSDFMAFSRVRNNSATYRLTDSLLIHLNSSGQIDYGLHVTNTETFDANTGELLTNSRSQNDSTVCKYDANGYLVKMVHYDYSGNDNSDSYSEDYVIVDGNVTEAISSAGYRHVYTYDDTEYYKSASYVYEMPLNTVSIKTRGGCWFMSNLPFLSAKYLGEFSKNNVVRTQIYYTSAGTEQEYADIHYEYTLDENNLIKTVKMTGNVNGTVIPLDYISTFTHFEKQRQQ